MKKRPPRRTRGRHRHPLTVERCEARQLLATFTVTSSADNGDNTNPISGSFREAILLSDMNPPAAGSTNTINFNIAGSSTIAPLSVLPTITAATVIDATQSSSPVVLDGINLHGQGSTADGLIINATGSIVAGLTIDSFPGSGIVLEGVAGTGSFNQGLDQDRIGTDSTGESVLDSSGNSLANGGDGVLILGSANNVILQCVISNNAGNGVHVSGVESSGNLIAGSKIGTDYLGLNALPNGVSGSTDRTIGNGVYLDDAPSNFVGDPTSGDNNLISGNFDNGIRVAGSGASGNLIENNQIGTIGSGATALGNALNGISIVDAPETTVGGTATGAGNLISGNGDNGINIAGGGSSGSQVIANTIGTNMAGTVPLGNSFSGVLIEGAPNITVGGPTSAAGNLISGNLTNGVFIEPLTTPGLPDVVTTGDVLESNKIGTDSSGLVKIGNQFDGVYILNSPGEVVGGVDGDGNVISGNQANGIRIEGVPATGNLVEGNELGVDSAGSIAIGNAFDGIFIDDSPKNTIGGLISGAKNVISANGSASSGNQTSGNGIVIEGSGASGNLVERNYIGTNAAGTAAFNLGNFFNGVFIEDASNNIIGGTSGAAANVLSGNFRDGVQIEAFQTTDPGGRTFAPIATANLVEGNFIGTDITGTKALGNTQDGAAIFGASGNTIGGTASGAGNLLSGNDLDGVAINRIASPSGSGALVSLDATGNLVANNFIGTDTNGTGALPNNFDGVYLAGVTGNTIGGSTSAARNIISANNEFGVDLVSFTSGTGASAITYESMSNLVEGNYVGVDVGGETIQRNSRVGVLIDNSSDNIIGGLTPGAANVVSGNGSTGIEIDGNFSTTANSSTGNEILGNKVGTDAAGTARLGNAANGVVILGSSDNIVGGTAAGAANVISGNFGAGIDITNAGTTGNLVAGNFIGTDLTASLNLFNVSDGIVIQFGASGNTIGGITPQARNVISNNQGNGVDIHGNGGNTTFTPQWNVVEGNYIGTNSLGGGGEGNLTAGILIFQANDNTVGGTTPGAGNLISNNQSGLQIGEGTGNLVQGNIIGLDASGEINQSNGGYGVLIGTGAGFNTIGGTASGAFNVISANNGPGVEIIQAANPGVTNNQVIGNRIGTDITGTKIIGEDGKALGNATDGILVINSPSNTINSNLISGNGSSGVVISGQGATGNTLSNNLVGTDINDATALGNFANGVFLSDAPGNQVVSNVISGNKLVGVNINGGNASGNLLTGNGIGTNLAGTLAIPNLGNGVVIANAPGNVIGLPDELNPNDTIATLLGNVISANKGLGVQILGAGSTGNVVQGDLIGTDFSGLNPLGNLQGGVLVNDASDNIIGGLGSGTPNVISANLGIGVQILASSPSIPTANGNLVVGNWIGLALGGGSSQTLLGNSGDGVLVQNASETVIAGNVISKNSGSGVDIVSGASNQVVANRIGTDRSGTVSLGNAGDGVLLNNTSATTIGGVADGSANVISGNGGDGIAVLNGSSGNVIIDNRVGTDITASQPAGNLLDGVRFVNAGASNSLFDNVISGNVLGAGVEVAGTSQPVIIQGNMIGLDGYGNFAIPNSYGIYLNNVVGETIGGTNFGARNVISGNTIGIVVSSAGTSTTGNTIQGNFIGTNAAGTSVPTGSLQQYGVFLNGAPFNTIGGTTSEARNVISGNAVDGILILNQVQSNDPTLKANDLNLNLDNVIQGNLIGTTLDGAPLLGLGGTPIQGTGIAINSSAGNIIGGPGLAQNIVGGNELGVVIAGVVSELLSAQNPTPSGNILAQNLITLNAYGVFINGGQHNAIVDTTISSNSLIGLSIVGGSSTGNLVEHNTIDLNGSKGSGATNIKLAGDGIYIDGASGNTIEFNEINKSGMAMTGVLPNGVGIYIFDNATLNVIASNTIVGSTAYGILVFNSAANLSTISRTGPTQNQIGTSGIAKFREFTGAVPSTTTTTSTPQGPKSKKKK